MSLTHYALLNAQPREKTYKLFDGHGLYLQVAPTGGKWWRVKYRLGGREQCLSLGTFPAVALKAARQRCEELRAKLASGVDPAAERRPRHLASVNDPKRVGALLRAIDGYDGRLVTKLALRLHRWCSSAQESSAKQLGRTSISCSANGGSQRTK